MSGCADQNAAAVWETASYKALVRLTSGLVTATNTVVASPLKQLLRREVAFVPQLLPLSIVAGNATAGFENSDEETTEGVMMSFVRSRCEGTGCLLGFVMFPCPYRLESDWGSFSYCLNLIDCKWVAR